MRAETPGVRCRDLLGPSGSAASASERIPRMVERRQTRTGSGPESSDEIGKVSLRSREERGRCSRLLVAGFFRAETDNRTVWAPRSDCEPPRKEASVPSSGTRRKTRPFYPSPLEGSTLEGKTIHFHDTLSLSLPLSPPLVCASVLLRGYF